MKRIKVNKDNLVFYILIDDEDYEKVSQYKWTVSDYGYAITTKEIFGSKRMHRVIMRAKRGQQIDHINGNKLDNRKENLRFCTYTQNRCNMGPQLGRRGKKSRFKGVSLRTDIKIVSWMARIVIGGKVKNLGCHRTEEEAAKAYNKAAKIYHGEFAYLNKI